MILAFGDPSPNTVCVAFFQRSHALQLAAVCRSSEMVRAVDAITRILLLVTSRGDCFGSLLGTFLIGEFRPCIRCALSAAGTHHNFCKEERCLPRKTNGSQR